MGQDRTAGPSRNALVTLGSNMSSDKGSPGEQVLDAIASLGEIFEELRQSRLYTTPAFPAGSGPDFINAAVAFNTSLAAPDVLSALHEIESQFARTRDKRWGPRTIDLDLIAIDDLVCPDLEEFSHWRCLPLDQQQTSAPTELILPHPRMQDRSFVLVPLADVAAEWRHPVLGLSVAEMLLDRPVEERREVRAIE
ncbi:MAG: 2-amino-4-hydroxy-6-hydroxymethyldihydropteridine diphosphokinase [Pseudomonadota bacterium]